jgi:hypothetical protein
MEIRKLISKFLTSICEKNYATANSQLKQVIEAKIKQRVATITEKEESKQNPFVKNKKTETKKKGTNKKVETKGKKKLSKEENKKRFLEMIKNKKSPKKGNKKG